MNHSKITGGEATGNEQRNREIYEAEEARKAYEKEKADEERKNRMKGVVCWFYVYKNITNSSNNNICGIVVIKQLTDEISTSSSSITESTNSSSIKDKNIFFYTKTGWHNGGRDYPEHFDSENLIHSFIHTSPEKESINSFFTSHYDKVIELGKPEKYKFIIDYYSKLSDFLQYLIDKKFDILSNDDTSDDSLVKSYTSTMYPDLTP
jgi:hypothetical protein